MRMIKDNTLRMLVATVLDQLSDGDRNHEMRKHITVAQAEKYQKSLYKG